MSIWSEREPNLKKQSKYSSKNTENGTKFKGLTNYWTGKTILNLWPFQYRPLTTFTFTFMHLADAFIQSDLHCIQVTVSTFYQLLLSLGIEPMILALLAPCSTSWATGKPIKTINTGENVILVMIFQLCIKIQSSKFKSVWFLGHYLH